jgi:hypothetical protein
MYGGAINTTQCNLGAMPFTVRAHIESEIDRLMKSINALQDLKANLPTGYLDSSAHRLAPFLDISRVG